MAMIFDLGTGHVDHTPDFFLASLIAHQHCEQFAQIELVGLRLFGAAVHFDTGRVHQQVVYAQGGQVAMQPEAIPTITRIGRRVYIQKGDIDSFKAARRIPAPVAQGKGVRHG